MSHQPLHGGTTERQLSSFPETPTMLHSPQVVMCNTAHPRFRLHPHGFKPQSLLLNHVQMPQGPAQPHLLAVFSDPCALSPLDQSTLHGLCHIYAFHGSVTSLPEPPGISMRAWTMVHKPLYSQSRIFTNRRLRWPVVLVCLGLRCFIGLGNFGATTRIVWGKPDRWSPSIWGKTVRKLWTGPGELICCAVLWIVPLQQGQQRPNQHSKNCDKAGISPKGYPNRRTVLGHLPQKGISTAIANENCRVSLLLLKRIFLWLFTN